MLGAPYPVLQGVKSVRQARIDPQTTLDTEGPVRYVIPRSDTELILPCETVHELWISISAHGENKIDPDVDFVVPVNGLPDAIFKSCETKCNGTVLSSNTTSTMYPYRSHIENELFSDVEEKRNCLQLRGQYRTPGDLPYSEMTAAHLETIHKPAKGDRRVPDFIHIAAKRYTEGKQLSLLTKIHDDIFTIDKLLPPGTSLDVSLERADPKFALLTKQAVPNTRNFKIEIKKARLVVTYVTLDDKMMESIMRRSVFTYPIDTVRISYFSSSAALSEINHNGVLTGNIPKIVIIGLVESGAFSGEFSKDPFHFDHCDARRISVVINGGKLPSSFIETNFSSETEENTARVVHQLSQVCGVHSGITGDTIKLGNAFFAFNLTPSAFLQECTENYSDEACCGTMDVKVELNKPPKNAMITLLYTVTSNELKIYRSPEGPNRVIIQAPEIARNTKQLLLNCDEEGCRME